MFVCVEKTSGLDSQWFKMNKLMTIAIVLIIFDTNYFLFIFNENKKHIRYKEKK